MYRLEARGMAADASTPIEPGQQTISVQVTARWEYQPLP
jgi:uncharacterized protein YggE